VGNNDFNQSMDMFMTPCEDKDLAFALLHHLPTCLFEFDVKVKAGRKNE
jgi:hypothetical protein